LGQFSFEKDTEGGCELADPLHKTVFSHELSCAWTVSLVHSFAGALLDPEGMAERFNAPVNKY
jgi:hypothetical protein